MWPAIAETIAEPLNALFPIVLGALVILVWREGFLRSLGEILLVGGIIWMVVMGFAAPFVPWSIVVGLP